MHDAVLLIVRRSWVRAPPAPPGLLPSPWHLPPAWGDIPTWITAVATLGLLAGAIVTAVYAVRAFGEQTRQLGEQREINREQAKVLGLQAAELSASLAERRSAQASMVLIRTEVGVHPRVNQVQRAVNGPDPEMITAYIENSSDRPIYSPELLWDDGSASLAELAVRSHSERLRAVIMPRTRMIRRRNIFQEDAWVSAINGNMS